MRIRPTFVLPSGHRRRVLLSSPKELQRALDALTALNRRHVQRERGGRPLPPLATAGVRYRREYPREEWRSAPQVLELGEGDCEDLAAYRAARVGGRAVVRPGGPQVGARRRVWHIVVQHPDGAYTDPSAELGMRGSA